MTTSDTRGVSTDVSHRQDDADCVNDCDAFDLAHLDRDGVTAALRRCRDCPVLAECKAATADSPRPDGFVQAGQVWLHRHGRDDIGDVEIKACGMCGQKFPVLGARRKYCSVACSARANSRKGAA